MKKISLIILFSLTACNTVYPTMFAVGGSKSDATVVVAYEYGEFDKPVPNLNDALSIARKRCKAWSYEDAEGFDAGQTTCVWRGGLSGCQKWRVVMQYQCLSESAPISIDSYNDSISNRYYKNYMNKQF